MKLTYFAVRGRAEPARLMLELVREPYEFEGMTLDQWMGPEGRQRKLGSTPFGQLPVLKDGEVRLCQSQAIYRYLARKLGLYGDTLAQQARVDEVTESAGELFQELARISWDSQFVQHRASHRELTRGRLESLDRYLTRIGADAEHWVLPGRYTLADVMVAYILESLLPLHPGLVEDFPKLHHMMSAFFSADGVREYVRGDRRPRTWTIHLALFGGKPEETHQWSR